jgi:hypothetical protein
MTHYRKSEPLDIAASGEPTSEGWLRVRLAMAAGISDHKTQQWLRKRKLWDA